jgi:hypothetical protein
MCSLLLPFLRYSTAPLASEISPTGTQPDLLAPSATLQFGFTYSQVLELDMRVNGASAMLILPYLYRETLSFTA